MSKSRGFLLEIGEYMTHSNYFHKVILAQLAFIFVLMCAGCGYKAKPFYKQDSKNESFIAPKSQTNEQRMLFQGIDSKPSPSYEEYEE